MNLRLFFCMLISPSLQVVYVSNEEELADALKSGSSIKLAANILLSKTLKIAGIGDLHIDGSGFSIDGLSQTKCMSFDSSNATMSNMHIVNCANANDFKGGGITLMLSSSLSLFKVNITSCVNRIGVDYGNGGAVYIESNSRLVMSSCIISLNTAANGGAIYMVGGFSFAQAYSCVFLNNRALGVGGSGGGWYVSSSAGGSLLLNKCIFEGNYVGGGLGGAVYVFEATLLAEECGFIKNTASGAGGIYLVSSNVKAPCSGVLLGCLFSENSAASSTGGGAVNANGAHCRLQISESVFIWNSAQSSGGAVKCGNRATCELSGCSFANNSDFDDPGASDLFVADSDVSVLSLCHANEYNPGLGVLKCSGCASPFPADLISGACEQCDENAFSCCGSLGCEATSRDCTSTEVSVCSSPTLPPSPAPSSLPTPLTWAPSTRPTTPTHRPTPIPSPDPSLYIATPSPNRFTTAPPSVFLSVESSWFEPSYSSVLLGNFFGAMSVCIFFALWSFDRSNQSLSPSLFFPSMLSLTSAGIETSFCYSMKLLALPLASLLVCASVLVYLAFCSSRSILDKKKPAYSVSVLLLALFEGDLIVWCKAKQGTTRISDRSVFAFSYLSLISRKIPVCIWMSLETKSLWRNILCVGISCISIIISLWMKLRPGIQRDGEMFESKHSPSLLGPGPSSDATEKLIQGTNTDASLLRQRVREAATATSSIKPEGASGVIVLSFDDTSFDEDGIEELAQDESSVHSSLTDDQYTDESSGFADDVTKASSDVYGIGSSLDDPGIPISGQSTAHLPRSRHSFPGTVFL